MHQVLSDGFVQSGTSGTEALDERSSILQRHGKAVREICGLKTNEVPSGRVDCNWMCLQAHALLPFGQARDEGCNLLCGL